jgi:pectate lyase
MRVLNTIIAAVCLIALVGISTPAMATANVYALGRETLAPNDGWASFGTNNLGQAGTTGGASADDAHVYTVTNRQELVAALGGSSPTPKIIYVQGTIDANVNDANQPLTCADYAAPGYSLEAYLQAYNPATWGRTTRPSGPLETARQASQRNQAARIQIRIGSNTTLVGLEDARIVGANLIVDRVDNVIIRNITFQDAFDCFPQWDPTDGSAGNWNSAYDNISLTTSTHVWADHNAFNDGDNPDSSQPLYFGRPYQVHDGSLDITRGSDLVTVSWNRFSDHDKTMLIGATNNPGTPGSPTSDFGKLRVTVHHNLFSNVLQRVPRVRFGQVHVYNNYYEITEAENYGYSWGVGVGSQIYAENNYFQAVEAVTPDQFIADWRGADRTATLHVEGTLVNGHSAHNQVDLVAAYNAVHDPDLPNEGTWTPTLYTKIHPTQAVPGLVLHQAGPLR